MKMKSLAPKGRFTPVTGRNLAASSVFPASSTVARSPTLPLMYYIRRMFKSIPLPANPETCRDSPWVYTVVSDSSSSIKVFGKDGHSKEATKTFLGSLNFRISILLPIGIRNIPVREVVVQYRIIS